MSFAVGLLEQKGRFVKGKNPKGMSGVKRRRVTPSASVKTVRAEVKRQIALQTEKKYLDTVRAIGVVAAAGTIMSNTLIGIPQNDTESGRTGTKVIVKSVGLHCTFDLPDDSANPDQVRLIVYVDKQTNLVAATPDQILNDNGVSVNINSWRQLDYIERFELLLDEIVDLNYDAAAYDGTNQHPLSVNKQRKWWKKIEIPAHYTDAAGVVGSITSANIGVLALSLNGLARLGYIARVTYTDS